jgi:(p)ppGpp synthase/HD superfamily hydrolase
MNIVFDLQISYGNNNETHEIKSTLSENDLDKETILKNISEAIDKKLKELMIDNTNLGSK